MAENTAPLARDRGSAWKSRKGPQRRSPFYNTEISLWILAFIVLAFSFDHAVSDVMSALGYERNKISNIWFLRNQYAYWADVKHVSGLADSFHVFELFVWAMLPLNLARVAKNTVFLGYADDVRSPWNENVSGGAFVLLVFLCSLIFLAATVFLPDFSKALPPSLVPYPKAVIGLQAWIFCVGSLLFGNGVLAVIQLNLGRSRRNNG